MKEANMQHHKHLGDIFEDIFQSIQSLITFEESAEISHNTCLGLQEKIKLAIALLDKEIVKTRVELMVGVNGLNSYGNLCDDSRLDILQQQLMSLGEEEMLKDIIGLIGVMKEKMMQLDAQLKYPSGKLCEAYYHRIRKSGSCIALETKVSRAFNDWKRPHLSKGSEKEKKQRLEEYVEEQMVMLFRSGVLKLVVTVKSRGELKKYTADYDFESYGSEAEGLKAFYYSLMELMDCERSEKGKLLALVPNPENLGRFLYDHHHELDERQKLELLAFILLLECVQKEMEPAECKPNFYGMRRTLLDRITLHGLPLQGKDIEWLGGLMDRLEHTPEGVALATEWLTEAKRGQVMGKILGGLAVIGVIDGNNTAIAKVFETSGAGIKTFAIYIGQGRKSDVARWMENEVKSA